MDEQSVPHGCIGENTDAVSLPIVKGKKPLRLKGPLADGPTNPFTVR